MTTQDELAGRPDLLAAFQETYETVLTGGLVERELKELCYRYLAGDDEVVAAAQDEQRYTERERTALAWAHATGWDADTADAALWDRLHASFTDAEMVDLGYAFAFMLGQQHFLATRARA
jgi:alkylhydroperoxidase family enzyme